MTKYLYLTGFSSRGDDEPFTRDASADYGDSLRMVRHNTHCCPSKTEYDWAHGSFNPLYFRRNIMDKFILKNHWGRLKGEAQNHWDDLSHDEVDQLHGDWNKLARKLQEKYGYSRSEADEEIEYFIADLESTEYEYEEDEYREVARKGVY